MPCSYPADTFEVAWVLYFLLVGGLRLDPRRNATHRLLLRWLQDCLSSSGASFARLGGLPADVDDTAVVLTVLNRSGIPTLLDPLWGFLESDHFVSYAGERTASTSSNAHVLEALLSSPAPLATDQDGSHRYRLIVDRLVEYLLQARESSAAGSWWTDKWHQSPYYATLSCILALCRVPDPAVHQELRPALGWLLETERPGGGWGEDGSSNATAEETAYGLLALRALRHAVPVYEPDRAVLAMASASRRLADWSHMLASKDLGHQKKRRAFHADVPALPALWVDKTPYAPARVIRAAMLASLHSRSPYLPVPPARPAPPACHLDQTSAPG
jgi:halimadienyl-diphosphate synthase